MAERLENPILNSPYEPAQAYFEIEPGVGPTTDLSGALVPGPTGNDICNPYARLKKALKADIDEEAWATLYCTESRPFAVPCTGKSAVKVVNDYGDEVMKVIEV